MRILLVLSTMMTACVLATNHACAQPYPFCLRGCDVGAGDCSFTSYAQCQASAAGRTAWCDANPDFRPVGNLQTSRIKMSRRRL